MKIFTVAEMVAAEKAADEAGVSYSQMMERAGRQVAEVVQRVYSLAQQQQILILVGPGNNGGDGLVAGRYLSQMGAVVTIYMYRDRDVAEDDNWRLVGEMGIETVLMGDDGQYEQLRRLVGEADIIIDALLGTGVSRPIEGEMARLLAVVGEGLGQRVPVAEGDNQIWVTAFDGKQLVEAGDEQRPAIVAVDCPSGLNCDTGALDSLALAAEVTVTFAGAKRGHFYFPGAKACGQLVVVDIGIDNDLSVVQAVPLEMATGAQMMAWAPTRPLDGHKGTFGKVIVIGGCQMYQGAPVLAALGALRAGSGVVTVAGLPIIQRGLMIHLPEGVFLPLGEGAREGVLTEADGERVGEVLAKYTAVLVGPGLGEADSFMRRLLASGEKERPWVVDADGLNILGRMGDGWWEKLPANSVLTPHPAEMGRLLGISLTAVLERERVDLALAAAEAWGHVVVLKGANSVVAGPSGAAMLIPVATPALATAGSGDVLAGVIVSLMGQGLSSYEAACVGAYWHGVAGVRVGGRREARGVLAREIADEVGREVGLKQ
ncbi:MAG TPA: NAD(P)H-hydrate dehydratase [Anaerolineae bacterium]|nr:NAD(P)H-hydrate dehydratase [Anaerolineae bacterium]